MLLCSSDAQDKAVRGSILKLLGARNDFAVDQLARLRSSLTRAHTRVAIIPSRDTNDMYECVSLCFLTIGLTSFLMPYAVPHRRVHRVLVPAECARW